MSENKALGKSLEELLNDQSLVRKVEILQTQKTSTNKLKLSSIVPNPYQPRIQFDDTALNELAQSIKEYGVFTPIIVRLKGNKYEIVAGERRYRASILAGKEDIPAIIENFSDQEMSEIALIENIQRENLNPLEISLALYSYQTQYNLTQQELADKFGKSRPYIANILRLRQLPKSIQEDLSSGRLSAGHVRTLVGLSSEEAERLAAEIRSKNLSVRETEALVGQIKTKSKPSKNTDEEKIANKLGAKVKLSNNEIKISFSSKEELEALLKKIQES